MSSFQIIVGSMLGTTEYVGEACEETLKKLGHQVNIHLKPHLSTIINQTFTSKSNNKIFWLICTSTHGAGDFPDNIKEFVKDLQNYQQDLSAINLLTIGIGDSNYDTFCKAANNLNSLLISKGCNELVKPKLLDMSLDIDPELLSQQWITLNNKFF